ncbi:hypothetical protein [uncultured Shimia sp.]|uniref:hypothetical protein n=1 Tax=uncultured Shimia sp. TaxID=573152 RepID=UPI0026230199|nr:hypothetical protein [uncultured Shimia sp.]
MKLFNSPLQDIKFSLTHVAGGAELPEWDAQLTAEIGGHIAAFAEGEIARLDEIGHRQGCILTNGRVTMLADEIERVVLSGLEKQLANSGWLAEQIREHEARATSIANFSQAADILLEGANEDDGTAKLS